MLGGHKDPDAGLYATASHTASILGHNLLNMIAVQKRWVIHYEDVSAAFLQGKVLSREKKVYVRLPVGYPSEVVDFLAESLPLGHCGDDQGRLWFAREPEAVVLGLPRDDGKFGTTRTTSGPRPLPCLQ